jgi:Kae1-associated kinase Bud32
MKQLISEGAEARIYLKDDKITKERIEKRYRHHLLDQRLRKKRTKQEAKILFVAKTLKINVPLIFNLNKKHIPNDKYSLKMEYLEGERLSDTLNDYSRNEQLKIMNKIGKQVSIMHKNNIIHSDLTTSNILFKDKEVYLIDFGLGFFSHKIEDKAVDLHLIKQSLVAKHFQNSEILFLELIKSYKNKQKEDILKRLSQVERRGRYKH